MAFDNGYTAVTGATYAASDYNTYTKGNFTAIWVGTTAGDMDYYSSATAKSRLALGAAYTVIYSNGSAPAYGSLSTIAANSALLASQAAGDIPYASSSSSIGRLALGSTHKFLKSEGGSAPLYGGLVYRRVGGDASNWATPGSTGYSPASTLIQCGVVSLTLTSGSGSAAVGFSVAYSSRPLTFVSFYDSGIGAYCLGTNNESTSGFTISAYSPVGSSVTISAYWLAIGAS